MQLMRQELERSLVEKDFLERNNRLLRNQYEKFAMHHVHSSRPNHSRLKTEQSKTVTNDYEMSAEAEEPGTARERATGKCKRSTSSDNIGRGVSRSVRRKTPVAGGRRRGTLRVGRRGTVQLE